MSFTLEINKELNVAYITTGDNRFSVAIERTPDSLEIRVYPITRGEIWDWPYDSFSVDEEAIISLEHEMEA